MQRVEKETVFILDRSISMEYDNKFNEAIEAIINIVNMFKIRKTSIVAFDHLVDEILPLREITNLDEMMIEALKKVFPRGNTNISKAIKFVNEQYTSTNFFLISDGRANLALNGSGTEGEEIILNELLNISKEVKEKGNMLSCVSIGEDSFLSFLFSISTKTSGSFFVSGKVLEYEKFKTKQKVKVIAQTIPEELPAGQPTWAKELNTTHVAVASKELFELYKNSKLTIVRNEKNKKIIRVPLFSVEEEVLKSFRERLPKRTENVRKGKTILLDSSARKALGAKPGDELVLEFLEF
ncbi:MAG: vWA domain-containing protein [Thermoproteota archaeon]|nr:VWA domain-containing protein [Candidatus Brockarchaeota archaeon]